MTRFAIIEAGVVVGVTDASEEFGSEQGWVQCSDGVNRGHTYADGVFTEPEEVVVVPASVTRRQAKQALRLAGLLANVQTAIDAIEDETTRDLAQIEWDDSQEFQRNRPILIQLATALGLDSAAIDQLFIQADKL